MYPVPTNEVERLEELRLFQVLDTAAETAFDDLTRLAASICEVPISVVSLVDEHRQWFKSQKGLTVSETPREHAFCAHTILNDGIMVVENADQDPRFCSNPLVTGEPHIRFYAGAPLEVRPGVVLGALCVIDRVPRKLDDRQLESLRVLRDAIVTQLELRRALADLSTLNRLVPICAWCRSVKIHEKGEERWQPLQEYFSGLSGVTHGICPRCSHSMGDGA